MSKAAFIEQVATKGDLSKAEAKRMVDLVVGEIEVSLKRAKRNGGKVSIGSLGIFTIAKRTVEGQASVEMRLIKKTLSIDPHSIRPF